jgi:hypothetical protein
MIWAFNDYDSSNGYSGVAYHGDTDHSDSTGWTMTLNSNGSVSSAGDVAPPPVPTPTDSNVILTIA